MTTTDPLADAVRAAQAHHAKLIAANADDRTLTEAYLACLRAERALESDGLAKCTTPSAVSFYVSIIDDLDVRIGDTLLALAEMGAR